MKIEDIDISFLRDVWLRRRKAVERVHRRADPSGMTRPARDPEEREWLRERGEESPFREVAEELDEWRAYLRRRR